MNLYIFVVGLFIIVILICILFFYHQYTIYGDSVKIQLIRGIKIGSCVGGIFCLFILNNIIWGNSVMGQQMGDNIISAEKAEVYQKFQNIRDPETIRWEKFSCREDYIDGNYILLGRTVVLSNLTASESLQYYYEFIKKNNIFKIIVFDQKNNIVRYEYNDVVGSINVLEENPTKLSITIRNR